MMGSSPSPIRGIGFVLNIAVGMRLMLTWRDGRNSYCRPLASDGGDFLALGYPGIEDMRTTEKGDWNDRVFSYLCFAVDV